MMTPRRLLALLLLAARAAAEPEPECTCTCLHPSCGLSFGPGAVDLLEPGDLNTVPCVDFSDCESAPQFVEGPHYQGCWTVDDGFPREDLPVSLCADRIPFLYRRRRRSRRRFGRRAPTLSGLRWQFRPAYI